MTIADYVKRIFEEPNMSNEEADAIVWGCTGYPCFLPGKNKIKTKTEMIIFEYILFLKSNFLGKKFLNLYNRIPKKKTTNKETASNLISIVIRIVINERMYILVLFILKEMKLNNKLNKMKKKYISTL